MTEHLHEEGNATMKQLIITGALALMGSTALAQDVVVKTKDTTSGDCLVAENGSVTLVDGSCAAYRDDRGLELDEDADDGPTRSRSINTSTILGPGS